VPQTAKILIRLTLFPLGMALLTAAFLFQGGTALSSSPQSMPTPDRLAQPTLPATPSQAVGLFPDIALSAVKDNTVVLYETTLENCLFTL
jgi:hypothetical protein